MYTWEHSFQFLDGREFTATPSGTTSTFSANPLSYRMVHHIDMIDYPEWDHGAGMRWNVQVCEQGPIVTWTKSGDQNKVQLKAENYTGNTLYVMNRDGETLHTIPDGGKYVLTTRSSREFVYFQTLEDISSDFCVRAWWF